MQHVRSSSFAQRFTKALRRSVSQKYLGVLFLFVFVLVHQSFGQVQVEGALNSIRSWIIVILNVAFLIGIGIGIFKAAMKFFTGSPDKIEFMIGMIICHDVIRDTKKEEYQGSSPDEVCFINFAS